MTTGRIYQASLVTPAVPKARLYKASLTGTAPAIPKARLYQARQTGVGSLTLNALTDITVEPLSSIDITASPAPGSVTPTTYTWRRISGPTDFGLIATGAGATVHTTAPARLNGTTLVLGVTATDGTLTSIERQVTITVLPQLEWYASKSGTWVAQPPTVAL